MPDWRVTLLIIAKEEQILHTRVNNHNQVVQWKQLNATQLAQQYSKVDPPTVYWVIEINLSRTTKLRKHHPHWQSSHQTNILVRRNQTKLDARDKQSLKSDCFHSERIISLADQPSLLSQPKLRVMCVVSTERRLLVYRNDTCLRTYSNSIFNSSRNI